MLALSEDQRLLIDSARGAISAKAPISEWRRLRKEGSPEGFSRTFWRECADMGWTGVLVPEALGGLDFGIVGAGLIAREMARTLVPCPFLSTAAISAFALRRADAGPAAAWLSRIAGAEAIVALAVDEGPRPGADLATRANGGAIAGTKHFVLDGHVADAFLVAARDPDGVTGLFLVEAGARGVARDSRKLVDERRVASVIFEGAEAIRLGGPDMIEATLDVGRAVLAASLCGLAEEAFARTISYLKDRKQFDRRIGAFQALQHRAAKMHIEIENAWSATLKALQALDAAAPSAALDVAVAKAKASETACAATAECLQMHGGIGMTDELDIGLFLKRARVDSVLLGDAAFHADRVATMLGY